MKEIIVYADWHTLPKTQEMGVLRSSIIKGQEIFSFTYNESWLKSDHVQVIDPDLKLFTGSQYLSHDKPNFGLFLDSSPDRWGKMLMDRREAINARTEGRKQKRLLESDYLLGVNDYTRMGALRFKLNEESNYIASTKGFKIPPIANIRELEQASLKLEEEDNDANKWLSMLIAPGSSLGGARPKANIVDLEGNLWIAKFPSKNDKINSGAWEFIVNQMAIEMGLNTATGKAEKFSGHQYTYLTKRFDRIKNDRIHFASAMTLLGYKDGHDHKDGGSYLELVELIENYGSNPNEDIKELWKRIVFSVAISNTDDHLRNHGFILTQKGWKLSPAYDINPNPDGMGLSLNINEDDNSLDYDLCMSVIGYFRLKENEALDFIKKTKKVISQWKKRGKKMNISNPELALIENAFNV
ncbi:MAG: HipA domain-containing protein [Candidatus Marinimicrobia bacterium]|nr:HipA domain-containing protein [Candidatus Neomarinimicrobiota bacterium]